MRRPLRTHCPQLQNITWLRMACPHVINRRSHTCTSPKAAYVCVHGCRFLLLLYTRICPGCGSAHEARQLYLAIGTCTSLEVCCTAPSAVRTLHHPGLGLQGSLQPPHREAPSRRVPWAKPSSVCAPQRPVRRAGLSGGARHGPRPPRPPALRRPVRRAGRRGAAPAGGPLPVEEREREFGRAGAAAERQARPAAALGAVY